MDKENLQENISEWIEELQYQSYEKLLYLDCDPPDDVFGWGEIIQTALNYPVGQLRRNPGFLLTGESGCGKHTAADHAVKFLTSPDGWALETNSEKPFKAVYIEGENLIFLESQNNRVSLVYEYLNGLLDFYEGIPLCIIVDHPEKTALSMEFLRQLGRFSCMYSVHDDELAPLVLIVITDKEEIIPNQLRKRLNLCRMTRPSFRQRLNYFMKHSQQTILGEILSTENGFDSLAEISEEMTYAEIRDLTENLIAYSNCGGYDCKDVISLAMTQIPVKCSDDIKDEILRKLNNLIDDLPDIIGNLSSIFGEKINTSQIITAKETIQSKPHSDIQDDIYNEYGKIDKIKFRQHMDNITTGQLAIDVFGEEEVIELLKQHEVINKNNTN